ncbi:MAG: hypothetical protein K5694_01205 [Bacilli bacterium]|nr:hypothetical protein [Bacilli bacterium]
MLERLRKPILIISIILIWLMNIILFYIRYPSINFASLFDFADLSETGLLELLNAYALIGNAILILLLGILSIIFSRPRFGKTPQVLFTIALILLIGQFLGPNYFMNVLSWDIAYLFESIDIFKKLFHIFICPYLWFLGITAFLVSIFFIRFSFGKILNIIAKIYVMALCAGIVTSMTMMIIASNGSESLQMPTLYLASLLFVIMFINLFLMGHNEYYATNIVFEREEEPEPIKVTTVKKTMSKKAPVKTDPVPVPNILFGQKIPAYYLAEDEEVI